MPESKEINFISTFCVFEGYGGLAEMVSLSLKYITGTKVNIYPINMYEKFEDEFKKKNGLSDQLWNMFSSQMFNKNAPSLLYHTPDKYAIDMARGFGSNVFVNTMYETNRIPPDWTEQLNSVPLVIVPTTFLIESMRNSGVTTPIEVIPEGYDPFVYKYIDRPERQTFNTLYVGPLTQRKNSRQLVEGWKKAFRGVEEARLILKSGFQKYDWINDDDRISIDSARLPTRGIASTYREADVLVAPGSEGFGMPLVEGMATGLPCIAMDTEGQSDICSEARNYVIPFPGSNLVPLDCHVYGTGVGDHWEPSPDDIAERLDWAFRNRQEGKNMGLKASEWVLKNRNVWDKGPKLISTLEKYGAWN